MNILEERVEKIEVQDKNRDKQIKESQEQVKEMAEASINKCKELEKKVSYTEVVKDQRSKKGMTKEVIKEKGNLVRDTR